MVFRAVSIIKVKVEVKPVVESLAFRLHYRYTYLLYMLATLLSSLYDTVGKKIDCMSGVPSPSFGKVVNNYCFIMGTFTVDRLHGVKVGVDAPHPGVGPHKSEEAITFHTYYQWVPFVLFFQGVMFYLPHWLWKAWEGGLFKQAIQNLAIRDYLGKNLKNYVNRKDMFRTLSKYVIHHMDRHTTWAHKFFFCEFLNLGVVIATLFFTDWFLGGEFLTYGSNVFAVSGMDPENRTDPMSFVFPKMAKCTFRSFGASGTIQVRDVMCLIATNIINEKIYIFLWVWLVLLTTVTSLWLVFRLLTIFIPWLRYFILRMHTNEAARVQVSRVMKEVSLSQWFLLLSLAHNMESSIFSEFLIHFDNELETSSNPKILRNSEES
nr:innexin inx2-like isoform X2 [Procambarus clarkii]